MPTKSVSAEPKDSDDKKESKYSNKAENSETSGSESVTKSKGILEVMPDGYGFLRANGFSSGSGDIYISQSQIRRFDIRAGDEVEGQVRPPKETERYFGMLRVEKVNGLDPDKAMKRSRF